MRKKRITAMLLVLVLVCGSLAACGSSDKPSESDDAGDTEKIIDVGVNEAATVEVNLEEEKLNELIASHTDANGKTFVTVALEDDPGSMNPYGSGASKPRQVVLEGIFEGMFCIQGTGGEVKPVLAESYEISEDGYTYTIKLKDYVVDSEGNKFTAHDVKFVLEEVALGEYSWATMDRVDEINVLDDYTIEVVFNTKNAKYIYDILIAYMFTEAAYKASPDGMIVTPVATGPYVLKSWVSGSEMVFEVRDDYWETDTSKIFRNSYSNVDKIIYKIIKEPAQRVIALEAKDVDIATGVSFTDLEQFKNNDDYNIFSSLQDQVVSLAFNCSENSIFQDVNARKAVAYAIDNQGVIDGVDQGFGELCYTAFASIFPDFDSKWETEDYYNYNIEKAKELIASTNYNGEPLTIMFENNDRLASVAQVIQAYVREIGINLEIFPCDGALFRTYRFDNTKADILMFTAGSSTFGSSSLIGNLNAVAPDKTLIGIKEDVLMDKINLMAENAYIDWSYAHDLHYYVKDNVYIYSIYAPINFTVTSKVVTGFVLNQKGKDSPNCSTYIWN